MWTGRRRPGAARGSRGWSEVYGLYGLLADGLSVPGGQPGAIPPVTDAERMQPDKQVVAFVLNAVNEGFEWNGFWEPSFDPLLIIF